MKFGYVFFVVLLFFAECIYAQSFTVKQTLEIHQGVADFSVLEMKDYTSIYLDSAGIHSFADISTSDIFFKPAGEIYPRLGYFDGTVWLKIEIKNMADNENYILCLEHPKIDSVQLYLAGPSGLQYFKTGDDYDFAQRPIQHRYFSFPMEFKKGQRYTCYFKIVSAGVVRFPLIIRSANHTLNSKTEFAFGIFFGALLLVFIYGNLAFIFTKTDAYFHYAQYVLFLILFFSSHSGHAFQWIYPGWPEANPFMMQIGAIGGLFFASLFALSLMEVRHHSIRLYNVYLVSMGWLITAFVVLLFNIKFGTQLLAFTSSFYFLLFILTGVFVWRRGDRVAVFFIPAWVLYFISSGLFFLKNKGILPPNFWTDNSFYFTCLIEVIIFAFVLSYKYRSILVKEKESEIVRKEQELELMKERLKTQQLQLQKDTKDRQLVSASLVNRQQDELLNSLKSIDSNEHLRKKVNSILVSKSAQVNNWENFKLIFEDIHPGFFKSIASEYPNLSINDLRQLAYIKMNLQIKEIASFTGVSVQAVKMARNRLKKKMAINESLIDVVNHL